MITITNLSMNEMDNRYFVYSYRGQNGELLYIGVDKIEDILKMRRIKTFSGFDSDEKISINIYESYDKRYKGHEAVQRLKNMLGKCKYQDNNMKIMCVETGQVFDTAYEACKYINTTPTRMSCHLKGRKGFKTIFGKTFKYI